MSRDEPVADAVISALFDAGADAVVVVDEAGRITLANAACERLLGRSPAALVGQPLAILVPERFREHARRHDAYMADPRPRGMGTGLPLSARHADGTEVPVDIALTPLAVDGRRWAAAAIRDMRGRVQGPEILRVQATALRSAANGIVITDRTGIITWVNPAACAITGYSPDELVGRHTRLLKSGQHDPDFYGVLWRTVTRGETWSGTIVNRRKDGTLYHEEQTIAPVVDDDGTVTHFIAIKQDVSERWKAEDALARAHEALTARSAEIEALNRKLREQAIRDPLTNLYNRRYLEEAIEREVSRAARTGEPLAIAALDLDRFKDVNDRHGHACGDLVLQAFARVLVEHARSSDLICRTGGEEFLVVLPGASLPVALARSEEWRASFAGAMTENAAGSPIRCTVSIGLSLLRPGREDFASAYRRADAALYEAKRTGRNRVVTAEPAA